MIFIDDCSTDNSIKILKEYANKDSRIKILCLEKNSGAAVARNKGLEVAEGEYLSFIDPDDAIDLNFYEGLYKKAKETNADIVKCERRIYETDGSITYSNLNQTIKERGDFFFDYEWTTAIYRLSLIKNNDIKFPPELIKAQDTAFLNKVMLKTTKPIEFVDNVYYNYYRRSDSLNAKEIPVRYIKSAVLSQKIQCEDLNNSNLYENNLNLYMGLYVGKLTSLLTCTAFQNVEYEAKLICAQGVIDCYGACKNKKAFEELFTYRNFLKYIKNNQAKKLASILYKVKTPDELNDHNINFWQKIFSIKKSADRRYKILRLFGVRFYFETKMDRKLRTCKFVHVMFNDKFCAPFVDFLNRNFDPDEHLVICKRYCKEFPFPRGSNVVEVKDLKRVDFSHENIKKVICHSLFDKELVHYLYYHPNILKKKVYWMIWGGDLYEAPRNERNDFVRKNFRGYISDVDGDCEVAMKQYDSNPETCDAGYTFPITKEMLNATKRIEHDYIQIQINNSANKTTLEIFDVLSKFKDENIKITTILSYGQMEFKEEIIEKGNKIFGDKFEYLDEYLKPADYAQKLAQNDVLILNQNRQQGLGNCFSNLALGSKVFIKSEITTYNHFNSKGIKVFDTNEIKNMSFGQFISYNSKTKQNNMQKSLMFFDDGYLKGLWEEVFTDKIDTIEYWKDRASKFGRRSVYNMGHSIDDLNKVDEKQCNIYLEVLNQYLTGKEENALDFGCGPGRFEPMLSKLVKNKVYALDPTKELLDIAPKIYNVEYIRCENEGFKLPDNSIDLIFVSLVLGGITDEKNVKKNIAEMQRVAKDKALFFVVENTANEEDCEHWHYRSVDRYKELFSFCNLELVSQYNDLGEEISVMVGIRRSHV